ncbi:LacI family DNA-binding transcriptional regulator [Vibrio sp. 99-70-13A1]|uniref:LacI family DNA-binding transcriptional regulator n=1 Tax=Vibrio sp. 99-70-13A1 TaxID=2607601 RepID=UPI00149391A8|nr:LacI family DNA-binding transcriptional regulator [Vibrio sp. 99-70-13A1]NOH98331.1 LacI family transcriptional regulator [Vibrio sp. 99-70-13A1]
MARIKDVAELAGVNRSTVSRIINGEGKFRADTVRKVEAAMAELDYRPSAIARSLATSSSNMIGLLVTYYTGGFFGEMMDQVQTELDLNKKFLITAQGHQTEVGEREAIQRFNDLRCDGYVLNSRHLSDDELRDLARKPTPFVLVDRLVEGLESRCVTFDHVAAAKTSVEHLIAQGHQIIGCISGAENRLSSQLRTQGYREALEQAGLLISENLEQAGDYRQESGYLAAKKLYEANPSMTAIFSCSEDMTSGAVQFCHEQGIKIPEQIALISFDSIDRCEMYYPKVSSVHFPISDMARLAVEILMKQIKNQTIEAHHQLPYELRIRNSSTVMPESIKS